MKDSSPIRSRLDAVRALMGRSGVDLLLVRSTDRFLNEYVPTEESARVWISGFSGSAGEVLVGRERAYLAVDGRYWLQAEKEVDPALYEVLKVPLGTTLDSAIGDLLRKLIASPASKKGVVGFDPACLTTAELGRLKKQAGTKASFKALSPFPVEEARGPIVEEEARPIRIRQVGQKQAGETPAQKLAKLKERLASLEVDALVIQRLDEIAYLTNLRSDQLPYQATFKAVALVCGNRLRVALDPSSIPRDVQLASDVVDFVPESEVWSLIGRRTKLRRIGFDPQNNTEWARAAIEGTGAQVIEVENPLPPLKAKKNPSELRAMARAFAKADHVVDQATRWLVNAVVRGARVTEQDFALKVEELFAASGAIGQSFKTIAAAGRNGAIIHYSDPDPRRVVRRGELMLLDTGAYYEDGYATDLTRTFLVDSAKARGTEKQRRYFTLVLKAAIAGMSAVLPEGSRGYQLDAITRAPLWAHGLDFNHGTGHGVGINVHEFPPRIATTAGAVLEEGQVFSIEPGLYIPSFGGIRIENLCTLRRVPKEPGFCRVEPLTFAPLDKRLIEAKLLSAHERSWLRSFSKVHASKERRKLRAERS